jgi:hypothetical protein
MVTGQCLPKHADYMINLFYRHLPFSDVMCQFALEHHVVFGGLTGLWWC